MNSVIAKKRHLKNGYSSMLTPHLKCKRQIVSALNCKRRKVSAIREFPYGCGPLAASLSKQSVRGVNKQNTHVSVIRDFPNGCCPHDASLCKQSVQGVNEPNVDVSKYILKVAESCGKKRDLVDETLESVNCEGTYLKNGDSCILTPQPKWKRRKVSAVRKFPSGCGPNAASVCKQRVQGVNEPETKGLMEQVIPSNCSNEVEMKEPNSATCGQMVKCKINKSKNLSVENPKKLENIETFEETPILRDGKYDSVEVRQGFLTISRDSGAAVVCGLPADFGHNLTKLGHNDQTIEGKTITKVHEAGVMSQNDGFLEGSNHQEDMIHEKPINDSMGVRLNFPTILNDCGSDAVCGLPVDCGHNLSEISRNNQVINGKNITKVHEAGVMSQNDFVLERSNNQEDMIHEKPINHSVEVRLNFPTISNDSGSDAVCGLPADCGRNLAEISLNNSVIKGKNIAKLHEAGVVNQKDEILERSNNQEDVIHKKPSDIDEVIIEKRVTRGDTFRQSSQNERLKKNIEDDNDELHLPVTEQSYNGNGANGGGSLSDMPKDDAMVFEDGTLRKSDALQPNNCGVMEIKRNIIVLGITHAASSPWNQAAKLSMSSVSAKTSNGKKRGYDAQHNQKHVLTNCEDSEEKLMEKPKVEDDKNRDHMQGVENLVYSGKDESAVESLLGMPKNDAMFDEKDEKKKTKLNSDSSDIDIERGVIVLSLACAAFCPSGQVKAPAKSSSCSAKESNGKTFDYDEKHNQKHSLAECNTDGEMLTEKPIINAPYLNEAPVVVLSDDEDNSEDEEHVFEFLPRPRNNDGTVPGSSKRGARANVQETLRLFELLVKYMHQGTETISKENGKDGKSVHLRAVNVLKEQGKYMNTQKVIGSVPGVEIGDSFSHPLELEIVGLHSPPQSRIETVTQGNIHVATSVVASGGHDNDVDNPNVLIYTAETHKLDAENFALNGCIDNKNPVRVIRVFELENHGDKPVTTYTYDGLYTVEKYWSDLGPRGKLVYKFELIRIPGQHQLTWKDIKQAKNRKLHESLFVDDVSSGKEIIPISAVNVIDDEKLPPFTYITSRIYPDWCRPLPLKGCDCKTGCSKSVRCSCTFINGGRIPYNLSGAIVEAKSLVYECGPSCNCPPSCPSRVSQHGIKLPLEIFKTESMGWGVRCLSFIPSGSFICEYIGELLDDKEAEQRVGGDEYLFDIGRNYKSEIPSVVENVGFTIDAATDANVGRFFNHSCSPNLYAQNVLYDHEDERVPHVMLFAAEDIPPLQELTYHYNYTIDQVFDSEGNIKVKKCCCGSPECTGRMY